MKIEKHLQDHLLDSLPGIILTIDPGSRAFTYQNRSASSFLRQMGFVPDASSISNLSFDDFAGRLKLQHRIDFNRDDALPWTTKLTIEAETIELRLAAIKDDELHLIGVLCTISMITNDVRIAGEFDRNVKTLVNTLDQVAGDLTNASRAMSDDAGQTLSLAKGVETAAETTAQNISSLASAAEEMTRSTQEISRRISDSVEIAARAVHETKSAEEIMAQLSKSATQISGVVNLIHKIASQTNLLALNATIEAARAGDAGRGFSVVAAEVKNLSRQTAEATSQIDAQIKQVQDQVTKTLGAISSVRSAIDLMNDAAGSVAAAIEQQGAATQEIAHKVEMAATESRSIGDKITIVAGRAESTEHRAEQVKLAAADVTTRAGHVRQEVDGFLVTIRRAEYRQAQAALDANVNLLLDMLLPNGGDFDLINGRLCAAGQPVEARPEVIAGLIARVGGVATVFQEDMRLVTNITDNSGRPATGTKLAPGPIHQAVLERGEAFRGQAEILGRSYLSVYLPLKARSGRIVGIAFVGAPVELA
jgi:methyl-accepting chemotaxis protein